MRLAGVCPAVCSWDWLYFQSITARGKWAWEGPVLPSAQWQIFAPLKWWLGEAEGALEHVVPGRTTPALKTCVGQLSSQGICVQVPSLYGPTMLGRCSAVVSRAWAVLARAVALVPGLNPGTGKCDNSSVF